MFKRVIVIVLDSVGIGSLPDADTFGDTGANTLGNIAATQGGLSLPVLEKLGLGAIEPLAGVAALTAPAGCYGKMTEISSGKDTTTGHWEMAGCPLFNAMPVYPDGFPQEVMAAFTALTGYKALGNKSASGTAIIDELGPEHMRTGQPIVYTSADSVFQIAAHEEIIPLEELYRICQIVRSQVCIGEHAVGRIIARPFVGTPGQFRRTANRHDYSLEPAQPTILDMMKDAGYPVTGIGKIGDIFAQRGLTRSLSTKSNDHGMYELLKLAAHPGEGLIMLNLVEFDSNYGHRNDPKGYAKALERVDGQLAMLLPVLTEHDLLVLTADHGCDPTFPGTDHTREYVPLLAYCHNSSGQSLGIRSTFADLAATIAENFGLAPLSCGSSFLAQLRREEP